MNINEFDYQLPKELIAQRPLKDRDQCRLMILDRQEKSIEQKKFYDVLEYLKPGDCIVMNDSKVIPARIFGVKESTGAKIEFLLIIVVVRNMGLSIDPKVRSVRIEDRNGVKQTLSVLLIEADRKNDFELLRDLCEVFYSVVFLHRLRKLIIFVLALLAEILALKELREQDDLCAVRRRFSHKFLRICDIHIHVSCAAHLYRCDFYFSHFIFPPVGYPFYCPYVLSTFQF